MKRQDGRPGRKKVFGDTRRRIVTVLQLGRDTRSIANDFGVSIEKVERIRKQLLEQERDG